LKNGTQPHRYLLLYTFLSLIVCFHFSCYPLAFFSLLTPCPSTSHALSLSNLTLPFFPGPLPCCCLPFASLPPPTHASTGSRLQAARRRRPAARVRPRPEGLQGCARRGQGQGGRQPRRAGEEASKQASKQASFVQADLWSMASRRKHTSASTSDSRCIANAAIHAVPKSARVASAAQRAYVDAALCLCVCAFVCDSPITTTTTSTKTTTTTCPITQGGVRGG